MVKRKDLRVRLFGFKQEQSAPDSNPPGPQFLQMCQAMQQCGPHRTAGINAVSGIKQVVLSECVQMCPSLCMCINLYI